MTSPGALIQGPLVSRPEDGSEDTIVVEHTAGTKYVATMRGHEVQVDQPLAGGGTPTPVELFVVSLATCVAYFAGQYLERHGVSRAGLAVYADYRKTGQALPCPSGVSYRRARRAHYVVKPVPNPPPDDMAIRWARAQGKDPEQHWR